MLILLTYDLGSSFAVPVKNCINNGGYDTANFKNAQKLSEKIILCVLFSLLIHLIYILLPSSLAFFGVPFLRFRPKIKKDFDVKITVKSVSS